MFPKAIWPLTMDQLSQAISQRFDSTVLLADNNVAGFANFYKREAGVSCAIGNVIISPQVRDKGAGRYLVENMTAKAFDKYHVRKVEISCFNENVTGLLLYSSLGFVPYAVEERVGLDGSRLALLHMRIER